MFIKSNIDYYQPKSVSLNLVDLPYDLLVLVENLAEIIHDEWVNMKLQDGWTYGELRYDRRSKQTLSKLLPSISDVFPDNLKVSEWYYGDFEIQRRKKHPCLVPFNQLSDNEKNYNRELAKNYLKLIISLGYKITKHEE